MNILSPVVWFPKNLRQATSIIWWSNIRRRFYANLWEINYKRYIQRDKAGQEKVTNILDTYNLGSIKQQLMVYFLDTSS
jgi:uncharacterized membrane protein YwzB